ncbi:septum formation initiator family protein [Microlunatus sp. Y2014]|uniref:FtsB family cell division protein n=1 Tax=Microlunatus sp. Y2014 TaxID=3418488 RepID=UPI003DA78055
MAERKPGRTPRPTAGPGRRDRTRRHRSTTGADATARKTAAAKATTAEAKAAEAKGSGPEDEATDEASSRELATARRRSGLTTRAIALGVVVLLLTMSYASSLRVYFDQRRELAATEHEISQREQHISDLEAELQRWHDPAYVRAQARERLGWAMPGEVGYRVVGPDGKPIVPGAEIETTAPQERSAWWQKMNGSMRAADQPEANQPGAEPTPPPPPRTVGPSEAPSSTSAPR